MMKKILLSTFAVVIALSSFAQIYIDTGNPELEKIKSENPDAKIWGSEYKDVRPTYEGTTNTNTTISTGGTNTTTSTSGTNATMSTGKSGTVINTATPPSNTYNNTTTTTTNTYNTNTYNRTNTATTTSYNTTNLSAANDDLPPFAEAGKCYARCFIPDQFNFVEKRVIDKPATYKTQVLPAIYRTVYDTVVVRREGVKVEVVPAVYETINEQVMASPATTRWEKGKGDPNCLSADPKDCQVMCLVEIPATYKTVSRKVLKTPSYTRDIVIPGEYKIVAKQIIEKPEQRIQTEVAATYKTVMEKQLTKNGGYTDWREVLCGSKLTTDRIAQIQRALIAKGYNVGPAGVDNVFGADTKAALIKYQNDKGLPVGNLNLETLRSLGVDY